MSLASTHHELDELNGGRYRSTIHMKPIASYRNGSLRRDPMTLSATGDATWPLAVDGICGVRIARRIAGKSPLLHMGHGKDFVRFALVGANNVSGTVKGNTTTFTNAWNNADLRYTYGGHRLQKDIPLRTKHPRSFGFILREHTGFDPVTMTVGDIRILDPVLEPPDGDMTLAVPLRWIVTQQGGYWVLTVTLPEGDWAGWTLDPTLTLQPDATDGKDDWMDSSAPDKNYGTTNVLALQANYRCVIQFEFSSLPVGAVITSATLSMYCYTSSGATTQAVARILAADDWLEAQATWNNRKTATAWVGAGGCSTSGTDYSATLLFNSSVPNTTGVMHDMSLAVAEFALMITGTNNGMVLGSTGTRWYRSSDSATAGERPKLVVEYELPGSGGMFQSSIFHSAIYGGNLTR